MNDGDTYDIPSPEFALVSDYSVVVLTRENGRMLNRLQSLINISEVTKVPEPADRGEP